MTGSDEERPQHALSLFRIVVDREDGQPSARVLDVDGDSVHIGTHPSNDVVLRDAQVAPFHCSLTRSEGGLRLIDTGSQRGTWVSGLCVRDADLAGTDAQIVVGSSRLTVSVLAGTKESEIHPEPHWGCLVGGSPGMRRLFAALERASASSAPFLVEGESGSGKTLVARELVRLGARQGLPFTTLDCRSFASGRYEGEAIELDRHVEEPGSLHRAFTLSSGGTLLLENVDELPLPLQEQLLRFLEAQAGGGPTPLPAADVRIVATSTASLRRAVNRGLFREDLFLRLSQAAALRVPPVRERLEDLPLLIQAFLTREHPEARSWGFTSSTLQDLRRREWPGNVRELFEYVTRALDLGRTEDVPLERAGANAAFVSEAPEGPPSVVEEPFKVRKERLIESFEREYLRELMTWAAGNVSRAARKARIDRMYLHRLLVRHGIERRQSTEH